MIVFIEFKAKRIFRSLEKKVEICSLNFFSEFSTRDTGFEKKKRGGRRKRGRDFDSRTVE